MDDLTNIFSAAEAGHLVHALGVLASALAILVVLAWLMSTQRG